MGKLLFLFHLSFLLLFGGCAIDSWVPDGGWQVVGAEPSCQTPALEAGFLAQNGDTRREFEFVRSFFKKCGAYLRRGHNEDLLTFARDMYVEYQYTQIRAFQDLFIPNLDGERIHAHLLIKPGQTPRPIVVVNCGLQCELGSPGMSLLAMQLFDEGPFHVLLLPSNTAPEFQSTNGYITAGGFDEGRSLFLTAQYVKSPEFEYSQRVSTVHVLGVSLGGQAALFASLFNSKNLKEDGSRSIQSFIAGCPVVDLEKSVRGLYRPSLIGDQVARKFKEQLNKIRAVLPIADGLLRLIESGGGLEIEKYPDLIAQSATDHYRERSLARGWGLKPFRELKLVSDRQFWNINRFQDFASEVLHSPIFIWSAMDDQVVNAEENAKLLRDSFANNPISPIHTLLTLHGNHCGFAGTYGWKTAGTLIRNTLIAQSPELLAQRREYSKPLEWLSYPEEASNLTGQRSRVALQWRAHPGLSRIDLVQQIRYYCNPRGKGVVNHWCLQDTLSTVSASLFEIGLESIPRNESEAQALTRWLNTHISVTRAYNQPLGEKDQPQEVHWSTYD